MIPLISGKSFFLNSCPQFLKLLSTYVNTDDLQTTPTRGFHLQVYGLMNVQLYQLSHVKENMSLLYLIFVLLGTV